jgi:hypothetical protein
MPSSTSEWNPWTIIGADKPAWDDLKTRKRDPETRIDRRGGLMGVEWQTGTKCTRVSEMYPQNSTFEFGAGALAVDCLWRVIERGRLRLTSGDHGQQYGLPAPLDAHSEAEALLKGRRFTACRTREETADLILEFEGDVQLEVISVSSGYEPWNLTAPGVHVIALGGGGLEDFSPTT